MRSRTALVCLVAVLAFAVCGGDDDDNQSSSSATTTKTDAAATTTAAISGTSFKSDSFVVPFSVTVPDAVKSPPTENGTNMVSWDSAENPDNKIRFLAPVEIYRPNAST